MGKECWKFAPTAQRLTRFLYILLSMRFALTDSIRTAIEGEPCLRWRNESDDATEPATVSRGRRDDHCNLVVLHLVLETKKRANLLP